MGKAVKLLKFLMVKGYMTIDAQGIHLDVSWDNLDEVIDEIEGSNVLETG